MIGATSLVNVGAPGSVAAARFGRDAGGDALLALAAGGTIGIALLVPVTVPVLGGVLALAAVAVDERS